jgi:hypothetical protein
MLGAAKRHDVFFFWAMQHILGERHQPGGKRSKGQGKQHRGDPLSAVQFAELLHSAFSF